MKRKASDSRTAEDYARERRIATALESLWLDFPNLPNALQPLVEAVRSSDWQSIANAAILKKRTIFQENAERAMHWNLNWIAARPKVFGLKEMTKYDALKIYEEIFNRPTPPNMKETWKRAGLDHLPQARHGGEQTTEKMRTAYEEWLARVSEERREIDEANGKRSTEHLLTGLSVGQSFTRPRVPA